MTDTTYQKFVKRWEEVMELPPQTLGPLTPLYKRITKHVKVMPFPWFVAASLLIAFVLYLVFGSAIILLVSILQKGF